MGRFLIEQIDEATAARIATVMGDNSAHALALAEMAARRARGEDPVLGRRVSDGVIIVVSREFTEEADSIEPAALSEGGE